MMDLTLLHVYNNTHTVRARKTLNVWLVVCVCMLADYTILDLFRAHATNKWAQNKIPRDLLVWLTPDGLAAKWPLKDIAIMFQWLCLSFSITSH